MNLIQELKNTQAQTLQYFELSATDLDKSYADGKWNNRQLLHHLADAETVLHERIKRTIAKPDQVIWGFDQDAWASQLNYRKLPLRINKNIYIAVRQSILYLAQEYYESLGEQHYFVHSETGKRSLKDEFEKVARHNQHHLNQIESALKRNL